MKDILIEYLQHKEDCDLMTDCICEYCGNSIINHAAPDGSCPPENKNPIVLKCTCGLDHILQKLSNSIVLDNKICVCDKAKFPLLSKYCDGNCWYTKGISIQQYPPIQLKNLKNPE